MAGTLEKKKGLDMTTGNAFRLIIVYSIPLLLGNMLQQFYNMVDSWVVGNYAAHGDLALAAVGNGGPITFLVAAVFMGFSGGVTVLVAQLFGAGDTNGIRKAVNTAYSLIIPVGVAITIFFLLILKPLLKIMAIPPEIYHDTYQYTFVCLAFLIGPLGYNINTGIMQGLGDTRTPLVLLLCSSILNIILDMTFVIVFHLDALGVALATVTAQTMSWAVGILLINKRYKGIIRITPFQFNVSMPIVKEILRIGIPSALQMSSIALGNVVMQNVINANGTSFAAGAVCAHKIDSFIVLPCQTFSNAVTTYVGQNLGAGRMDRVNKGIIAVLVCGTVSTFICGGLTYIFADQLVALFNKTPDVIYYGAGYLKMIMPFYLLLMLMFTFCGVLRGMGKVLVTMIAMIAGQCVLRVIAGYILNALVGGLAIYYSFVVGWVIGAGIVMVYYFSGKWKKSVKSFTVSD